MRTWRSFVRLFEGTERLVALSLGVALAQSLALVPVGLLVRHLFDTVIPGEERTELVLLGGLILALYVAASGLGLVGRSVVLRAIKTAIMRLRTELLARIQTLPRAWLDRADMGELHSTIVQDSERVGVMATALLGIVLPAAVVSTALLTSLAVIDLRLLVILLAVLPALVVLGRPLSEKVRGLVQRFQRTFDTFSARILSNLGALTTIRAQGGEPSELEAGSREIAALSEESRRMAWLAQAQIIVHGTTAAVAVILVLVLGGFAVMSGDLSLGDLLSFFTVLALVRGQVTQALTWIPQIIVGREALGRLARVFEVEEPQPYSGRRRIAFRGAVTMHDVSFGYGRAPVLCELQFSIEPGERVALMGPNGSGKSTLVALLLGLYRPDRGRLLADGVPYDELDLRELRRGLGVLLQDPVLFRGSVRDNIAYGSFASTQEEISTAAWNATATEAIAELPDGYRTEVGNDGELLSAGQRQRIALARAFFGRPSLLILDEPTNHLDETTIRRLLTNLGELSWSPATLLITHDPVVAATADRVVEIRGGRAVSGERLAVGARA